MGGAARGVQPRLLIYLSETVPAQLCCLHAPPGVTAGRSSRVEGGGAAPPPGSAHHTGGHMQGRRVLGVCKILGFNDMLATCLTDCLYAHMPGCSARVHTASIVMQVHVFAMRTDR
jgi:hypothetical protein